MKCAIYIRVSSEDQAKQFSLTSQKKDLRKLAADRKFRVTHTYDEGGISGESLSTRPQMLQILDDAEKGEFEYLLIVSLDRLSRNLKDSLYIREKLQDAGVTILTPYQEFDHNNIDHDFTANLWGSIADYERKRIKERCDKGRREKRAKGGWLGGYAPKGYKYNPATKTLEVDQEAADGVIRILEGALDHSPLMLSRDLKKEGVTITPRQIRRIIEPSKILFYAGQIEDYDGNVINGQWPAIIKKDLAKRIQRAKRHRRVVAPGSTRAKYMLTGLGIFKCRICGRTVKTFTSGSKATKEKWQYYKCSSIQYGEDCSNKKMWRMYVIDNAVWKLAVNDLNNIVEIERAYSQKVKAMNESPVAEALEKKLNLVQVKQARLVEAVETGSLPIELISKRFQGLREQESEIVQQIDEQTKNIYKPDFDALKEAYENINFATDFTLHQKRIILKMLFHKIELSRGSIYLESLLKIPSKIHRIQLR